MKTPTITDVVYYRCTKRKQRCKQKFITQKALEFQFTRILKDINIHQEFYNYILEGLEKLYQEKDKEGVKKNTAYKKRINELKKRLDSLVLLRADGEIEKEVYDKLKNETKQTIESLEKEFKKSKNSEFYWLDIAKDYLNIALNASNIITNKDNNTKKNLLSKLGSNQVLFNQKLHIIRAKPLLAIQSCYTIYMSQKQWFEPTKNLVKQGCSQGFGTQSTVWRTGLNDVRTSTTNLQSKKLQENFLLVA